MISLARAVSRGDQVCLPGGSYREGGPTPRSTSGRRDACAARVHGANWKTRMHTTPEITYVAATAVQRRVSVAPASDTARMLAGSWKARITPRSVTSVVRVA